MIGGAILVGKRLGLLCTATPPCCKNGTFFEEISPVRNRHSGGYGVGLRMNVGLPSGSVMKRCAAQRRRRIGWRYGLVPLQGVFGIIADGGIGIAGRAHVAGAAHRRLRRRARYSGAGRCTCGRRHLDRGRSARSQRMDPRQQLELGDRARQHGDVH